MQPPRRRFLKLAAGAAIAPGVSRFASAQSYPSRPLRILVGFPAGGGADVVARLIGEWLSERLGKPVIVENRPGAATNIATEAVARAPADGHTLLLAFTANAINATLYGKLKFNFVNDIAPVAGVTDTPLVMQVNPSFPAGTVPEFIRYAKANPGKINMASDSHGALGHVSGELFKAMTGVNMVHVPFRGDPAATLALMSGEVQVHFAGVIATIEQVRSGKLRALAVTTAMRSHALPDVPAMNEYLAGYQSSAWFGFGAPAGTPVEIVNKLNREINAALTYPKIKNLLAGLGGTLLPGSPADFGKLIVAETEKWAKVIKAVGIKAT
jgi:tripartite-type tricarboxylate transporter receptor subunit TctC